MKVTNITEFKTNLSRFLALVEKGEAVEIRKRNVPIARVTPLPSQKKNRTKLGCGQGSVRITGDLTEPLIPITHWEMRGQ